MLALPPASCGCGDGTGGCGDGAGGVDVVLVVWMVLVVWIWRGWCGGPNIR